MSPRKFFSRTKAPVLLKEMKKDLAPIMERACKPVERFATRHPYATFWILFSIVAANILVLAVFTDVFSNKPAKLSPYRLTPLSVARGELKRVAPGTADLGIGDFLELRAIRDSVGILLGKKKLSSRDTLAFIGLTERFARIDTSFRPLTLENLKKDSIDKK